MIRISTNKLQPGMTIARSIYSANGLLLLFAGAKLEEKMILKLERLGIDSVFIGHPLIDIQSHDVIHEKTRVEALRKTQQTFEKFRKSQIVSFTDIAQIVKKIIEDVADNRDTLIHLSDIRLHDEYTFGHSLNVCLLSVMLGLKLSLRDQQLFELALGAMLHDLGKMLVPQEILNKSGNLTLEEWGIMKLHADKGFDILRKDPAISLISAHVAYQHHENYDGTGYSRGLGGESIHRCARIVAIADIYDAIISDRPYRKALLPHEAYEVMLGSRGSKLDPHFTDVFLENIVVYPPGSTVELDTGEIAVVVSALAKLQTRPLVRVIINKRGEIVLQSGKMVDLTTELTRFITKVFKPEEVFTITQKVKNM